MSSTLIIPDAYKDLYYWTQPPEETPWTALIYEGGRGGGKTVSIAQSLVLHAAYHPIRVLCCREIQRSISESVQAELLHAIDTLGLEGFEKVKTEIRHANGSKFMFQGLLNSPESTIKGYSDVDVCWIEEAQTISRESLQILVPTIRKENSKIIISMNFYSSHDEVKNYYQDEATELRRQRTKWHHVTWRDPYTAGILPNKIYEEMKAAEGTPDFAHVWEGMPLDTLENTLIQWSELEAAETVTPESGGIVFGVDVARYGNDKTAVTIRNGNTLESITTWGGCSLVESADRITELANKYKTPIIQIDDTGVGGGLTDILKNRGYTVNPINYAGRASSPKYPNIASELWFQFKNKLEAKQISINKTTAHKLDLYKELTSRTWEITASRNQQRIQPKKQYKEENATHSPDIADSVLLAFYTPLRKVTTTWNI